MTPWRFLVCPGSSSSLLFVGLARRRHDRGPRQTTRFFVRWEDGGIGTPQVGAEHFCEARLFQVCRGSSGFALAIREQALREQVLREQVLREQVLGLISLDVGNSLNNHGFSSSQPTPDLNPIEMAFSKLKAHLRAVGARTYESLWRAVGNICALFEPHSSLWRCTRGVAL